MDLISEKKSQLMHIPGLFEVELSDKGTQECTLDLWVMVYNFPQTKWVGRLSYGIRGYALWESWVMRGSTVAERIPLIPLFPY